MLAIGRAVMSNPKLLLLDEPSLGLAPVLVEEVYAVLMEIRKAGTPILVVEQNAFQALSVADRGVCDRDRQHRAARHGPTAARKQAGQRSLSGAVIAR